MKSSLKKIDSCNISLLKNIKLHENQEQYFSDGEVFEKYADNPKKYLIGMFGEEEIIGCFYLDFEENNLDQYFSNKSLVVLKGLSIRHNFQGKGIGKLAILEFLDTVPNLHFNKKIEIIVLSVNCKNIAAQRLYKSAGFIDTHEIYYGGKAGPQHVYYINVS
ncbi:MAG: hypothetical protein A3E87_10705 [Gammaproteobacteria bacterium RIFCSPHIGHO2_12_FULL_35_23]|nr:MAG: hypothetical protein A3E87_10705 [Gammaproteobacteria bacterium RIFCSPHIGHO2_12_FULL_35_23]